MGRSWNDVTGDTLYLWGKPYRLEIVYDLIHQGVEMAGDRIIFMMQSFTTPDRQERIIEEFYRAELAAKLKSAFPKAEKRTGISTKKYQVYRLGKAKYSVSDSGMIRINPSMAIQNALCLDLILVKALIETKEPSGTDRFYELLDACFPEWREVEKLFLDEFNL